jgi:MATE family multidrug resistance protein
MATALDTLCAQAYTGSEDKTVVGLYLQRGIIVCTLTFLPISVLWWNMGSILLRLGSDPALVALVDVYIKWRIVGVPPMIVFECLKKYLQAQGIVKAPSYIMVLVTPVGIILNHYLVINPSTSIGFIGAPIAFVAATWLSMFVCILYIMFVDGKKAWGGFSAKALTGWWPIVKLGLGGMLMTSIEWWAFGSMALVVSSFGTVQLAAHSVLVSLDNLCYMPHLGVSISASIRVGNHLGARLPNKAKLAACCSYFLAFCSATMTSVLLGGFAKFWANTFSNDPKVISLIVELMPIVVIYQVFDSCSSVSGGILRGEGRQSLGAYILLIGFYAVAVPLGVYLSVATPLKLWGVWIGFVLGLILCCSLYIYYFINTDWDAEVENTIKRLDDE